MCRLFGFRSVIQSQVHRSLISADNALSVQSELHPDGWGVAYYLGGAPHLIKSASAAVSDTLFHRVSGIVSSETVLAHVRRATQGRHSAVNTHPFQFGRWVFAHNGNLAGFEAHRPALLARIAPRLRRYILGETDSELLFFLLLDHMARRGDVHHPFYAIADLASAIVDTVCEVTDVVGELGREGDDPERSTFLTFIVTNGQMMLAHEGGKQLYFSTYKHHCPERDVCPSFSPECESRSESGYVNHLVFTSEPLHGENVWQRMRTGQIVGCDARMHVHEFGTVPASAAAI